jgi:hypothetical protein
MADKIPVGRLGTPDEIARVAVPLVSDDASYIAGQTVVHHGTDNCRRRRAVARLVWERVRDAVSGFGTRRETVLRKPSAGAPRVRLVWWHPPAGPLARRWSRAGNWDDSEVYQEKSLVR